MCGIVGYVGPRSAVPIIVGGLEKLEYRGYDSAGVAAVVNGRFDVHRSEGKLSRLKDILTREQKMTMEPATGGVLRIGLGHTRWATHGKPSEQNAHPHIAGNVCVVHNGIIENYAELRAELQKEGCVFQSDTDTEIAAHLVNRYLAKSDGLLNATRSAVHDLKGSYALVLMSSAHPTSLVVAKNSTPVIIGLGEGENYIASDIPAILEHTRKIYVLEDGEIAEVSADKVHIEKDGQTVKREPTMITWDAVTAEKGGFRHFMLKEIYEQPLAITQTFRGRLNQQEGSVFLDDVQLTANELRSIDRVCIVACGTAWHAALVTKFYIERLCGLPVEVDYGSEFRYRTSVVNDKTLFMVISQSGETADTLGSLNVAVENGAKTLAICNVVGSSIVRRAKNVLFTHAGPEISVASTKAFTTQLVAGLLVAIYLGQARGRVTPAQAQAHFEDLLKLPALVTASLTFDKQLERIARKYGKSEHFMFLGRGMLYPVALEGALKLKEISYAKAEGFPAGEMKHGPISLIGEETPVVAVVGHDGVNYEKVMSNLKEAEARGGQIIGITDIETPAMKDIAWEIVPVGQIPELLLHIVLTIPLQLLAYHVAVYRGTDVDQPRNLAKSVTVE
ncbi:MAG: glutamine--fructose-6-phosphate transaminase (isomerizing) [Deltaproteobacteria bacterium]|nr:glutamine--fructose-6-phosphate transaminase (isomerizing) [Deltaproteobacteria bacterium]